MTGPKMPGGRPTLRTCLLVLVGAITMVYPFIVYGGLTLVGPAFLSIFLFILVASRVVLRRDYDVPEQWVQLLLIGSLCLVAAWLQSESLLRFYPVVMNLAFAGFFLVSLGAESSLAERFARLFSKPIPDHATPYLRGLTKAWAALLLLNAGVSAYTSLFMTWEHWALYNGFLVYFVFMVFIALEFPFRRRYQRRYQERLQSPTRHHPP